MELVMSAKTVGTHLQHIMSKLEVDSRAPAGAVAHCFRDYDLEAHVFVTEDAAG
jgi:hypothetical protein